MGQKRDINTIHCYTDLSEFGNNALFSRNQIHEKVSKEVGNCFQKYGLEYEIKPLGEMGGGVISTLWETFKIAWNNKELIGIIVVISQAILNLPKYINSLLKRITFQQRPKVLISLGLETKQDCVDKDLGFKLSCRLINLKYLSDEICKKLTDKYSVFRFDQSFSLSILPRHFSVSYNLQAEQQNTFNSFRLIRLFKNLRIQNNTYWVYTFTKWLFISRFDGKLNIENNTRVRTPNRSYYLLFSTSVISDYFR